MEEARRKGYSNEDLMAGVRRGITAGAVKIFMDASSDLSLEDALEFLRSHLKEQAPSELLTELSAMKQKPNEEAGTFLRNAMKLRQQMVGTDGQLSQSIFLHTLRTGLRNDRIRMHMAPFLDESKSHSDAILIREMNRAVAEEKARQGKIGLEETEKKHSSAVVNSVLEQGGMTCSESIDNSMLASILSQMSNTQKQLQANQDQMMAMQSQVSELVKLTGQLQAGGGGQRGPFRKMCEPCTTAKRFSCKHCWKCGQEGHKSQECTSNS